MIIVIVMVVKLSFIIFMVFLCYRTFLFEINMAVDVTNDVSILICWIYSADIKDTDEMFRSMASIWNMFYYSYSILEINSFMKSTEIYGIRQKFLIY